MRFWRKWKIIRFTALSFAVTAIAAPSALAIPVTGADGGMSTQIKLVAPPPENGFDWSALEIGVGSALALVVLAAGTAIVLRRSRGLRPLGV
jgi:hypothetical protein